MSSESGVRVVDGILVAKDILSQHQQRTGTDLSTPIPLMGEDGVLRTISITSGVTNISVECVLWPGDMCRGWIERYNIGGAESARISYSSSLNTCWARLVICKEAAHLSIGTARNFTTDPVALVNGLIARLPSRIDEELDAESIALLIAMNILIPWTLADSVRQMHKDGVSNYEIAFALRVPELLVAQWLTSKMQAYLTTAYEGL